MGVGAGRGLDRAAHRRPGRPCATAAPTAGGASAWSRRRDALRAAGRADQYRRATTARPWCARDAAVLGALRGRGDRGARHPARPERVQTGTLTGVLPTDSGGRAAHGDRNRGGRARRTPAADPAGADHRNRRPGGDDSRRLHPRRWTVGRNLPPAGRPSRVGPASPWGQVRTIGVLTASPALALGLSTFEQGT